MVYYFKTKLSKEKQYIVVIDKPAFTEVELNGTLVGVRNQSIRYGIISNDLDIINQKFNINDEILGYNFSEELIEGYDNLYKLTKE
jgi:hypothetical protein